MGSQDETVIVVSAPCVATIPIVRNLAYVPYCLDLGHVEPKGVNFPVILNYGLP